MCYVHGTVLYIASIYVRAYSLYLDKSPTPIRSGSKIVSRAVNIYLQVLSCRVFFLEV